MYKQELRIVKTMKTTKEGKTFPRYVALFNKGDSIGYVDVSFTGDTLNQFSSLCNGKTYADVILSFGEGKADKDTENAFIADKRKKNENGKYEPVKDKKGATIPHVVIRSISASNLMKEPIKLPQTEQKAFYDPKDFFHKCGEKNAVLTNITDSDLPF